MGYGRIWRGLVAAALVVALLVFARRAEACGNEVLASTDDHVMRLKDAERALEDDDLVEARKLSSGVLHDLERYDEGPADMNRTERRARRILAVARARDPQTSPTILAEDAAALAKWRRRAIRLRTTSSTPRSLPACRHASTRRS